MAGRHPYHGLKIPDAAQFALRPSPGKGWGAFATSRIEKGARILVEQPLFVIRKHHTAISESNIAPEIGKLSATSRNTFMMVYAANPDFLSKVFAENSFNLAIDGSPAHGFFALHSRFNHSCVPNCKILTIAATDDGTITSYATRQIDVGEEILFCYWGFFESRIASDRRRILDFICHCRACSPGTLFQRCSDLRRRLVRGLYYLTQGFDLDGKIQVRGRPLIADPELKRAAERGEIRLSSLLIYHFLIGALLEAEGLLDEFMLGRLKPAIRLPVRLFQSPLNVEIASHALQRPTAAEQFASAATLYGTAEQMDGAFFKLVGIVNA